MGNERDERGRKHAKKEIGGKKKEGKKIQRVKTGKDSDKEDKNRQRRKWDLENENGQKKRD